MPGSLSRCKCFAAQCFVLAIISLVGGANAAGQVVGSAFGLGGPFVEHAFLWLPQPAYGLPAGMNDLGTLAGEQYSSANGINSTGQVVGGSGTVSFMGPSPAFA